MKNKSKVITFFTSAVVASVFCAACSYGPYPFTFFQETVDDRAPVVSDLTGSEYAPDVGTNDVYSFLVITDVHFGSDDPIPQDRFIKRFNAFFETSAPEEKKPRFLVCLGDCADNGKAEEWQDYNLFLDKVSSAAIAKGFSNFKCYSCIGNHDCYNYGGSEFAKHVYPHVTSYMFSVHADSSPKGFSYYFLDSGNGTLGNKQMKSFKQKIAEDSSPKIIMTHYQIFSGGGNIFLIQDYTERNMLLSEFAKNKVKLVLEGHWHGGASYDNGLFYELTCKTTMKRVFYLVTVNETTQSASVEEIKF